MFGRPVRRGRVYGHAVDRSVSPNQRVRGGGALLGLGGVVRTVSRGRSAHVRTFGKIAVFPSAFYPNRLA